jgi:hypothetical protein
VTSCFEARACDLAWHLSHPSPSSSLSPYHQRRGVAQAMTSHDQPQLGSELLSKHLTE